MHLEEFVKEERETLEQFYAWWKRRNAENPECYPMSFGDNDSGMWWEQLQGFADMSYQERMS